MDYVGVDVLVHVDALAESAGFAECNPDGLDSSQELGAEESLLSADSLFAPESLDALVVQSCFYGSC